MPWQRSCGKASHRGAEFLRIKEVDPAGLTDIERAARFIYLQACAYGGKLVSRTFAVSPQKFHGYEAGKMVEALGRISDRLAGVVIKCLEYDEFIRRYDSPNTLFYIDPPYYGCENYYGKGVFQRNDFAILAKTLVSLKGNFILSINDHPHVREIFGMFEVRRIPHKYSVHCGPQTDATELVITK